MHQVSSPPPSECDSGFSSRTTTPHQPARPSPSVPGDVVDHEGPGGPSVVGPGDGPEPLLTGRVPDLQLHLLTMDLHDPRPKLHPDSVRTVRHDCTHTQTHTINIIIYCFTRAQSLLDQNQMQEHFSTKLQITGEGEERTHIFSL